VGLLIQDGKAAGHQGWLRAALDGGLADGAILSPFATPPVTAPKRPNAGTLARMVSQSGSELVFDAGTHILLLPGVNDVEIYDEWDLWGGARGDLSDPSLLEEHVRRVFAMQESIEAPCLTPTVPLNSAAITPDTRAAIALGEAGHGMRAAAWQSLAGTRSFWSAGAVLDAYVGELAQLRAPVWLLTMIRDRSTYPPDTSDTAAEAGLARTVRSLSMRSRVIVAQSDFFGLPEMAAGADAVGSGWHTGQRLCSAESYIERSGGRNIRYVTHGVLMARLRPDVAEALEGANPSLAARLRDESPLPANDGEAREMHLRALYSRIHRVRGMPNHQSKVDELRTIYDEAQAGWTRALSLIPGLLTAAERDQWISQSRLALEAYAVAEGL